MNKHKSNKIKLYYSEALDNGTDHHHSKSCCDQRIIGLQLRRTNTKAKEKWPQAAGSKVTLKTLVYARRVSDLATIKS